jgi:hypothetical protein
MRRSYVVPMRWMVVYEYEVPGGALNLNSTKLPRPWSQWGSSPSMKNPRGRAGNRNRDLMIGSQKLWPLDHEAGHFPWTLFSYSRFVTCAERGELADWRKDDEGDLNTRSSKTRKHLIMGTCWQERTLSLKSLLFCFYEPIFRKGIFNKTTVSLARFGSLPNAFNQHHIFQTQSLTPLIQNSPLRAILSRFIQLPPSQIFSLTSILKLHFPRLPRPYVKN